MTLDRMVLLRCHFAEMENATVDLLNFDSGLSHEIM